MELLVVLVVASVLFSLAAPSFEGMITRQRTRGALNRLTGDLYHARVLAGRSGRPVVVRFRPSARCPGSAQYRFGTDRYVVVVRDVPEREVKEVLLNEGGAGVCLEMNQSDSMVFDSRGLLRGFGNRSIVVHRREMRDSLVISRAGRVLRHY